LRWPGDDAFAAIWRLKYITFFDVALNVLAYVPLGALACLVFRQAATESAIGKAIASAFAFSLCIETCQLFVPYRAAAISDVAANTAGAALGAFAFSDPLYAMVTRRLGAWRDHLVIQGSWGDAGLGLVVLWLLAQLNPALPFFEAGNIGAAADETLAARVLPAAAVALSVCGFGLFVSVILRGPRGALRYTLLLLTVALWLKFATASVMLKPHLSAEWVSEGRVIGLVAGIALFAPLRRFARPARVYLAALLILAGAMFSKIFGAYSALGDLLRLFSWPHGQLATFATLTRFLHEIWPLATLVFLVALFLRERRSPVR